MLIDRQDVLYAVRSARRNPLLTFVVVMALSVGIGLNAGVFTILDSMFLEPPTESDPASFVQIYPRYQGWFLGRAQDTSFNAADYEAIRAASHTIEDLAAWQMMSVTYDESRHPAGAFLVSCNYLRVFGDDRPLMGRFFNRDECDPASPARIAVLSEHAWRDVYSADPQIVGKVIHISHQPLTVIGIVADRGSGVTGDLWVPYSLQPAFNHGRNAFQDANWAWLSLAGRLRVGYSRADAAGELRTIMRQRDRDYLDRRVFTLDRKTELTLTDGAFIHNPAMSSLVMALMALCMGPLALVLLLACTNVTMLFLSRSVVRRGEIAVRLALGAGRSRLMRMMGLESFLTAAVAGVASIYLAIRFPAILFGLADPGHANIAATIHPHWKAFAFLAILVLVATFASALAPIRESFQFDLVTALKGREGSATMRSQTTSALIVVQVAMGFVLLAAAVLFARMPYLVRHLNPGFETHQVIVVPLDLEAPQYTEASARAFIESLQSRIAALPGVQAFAWESVSPFNVPAASEIRVEGQEKGQGRPASVDNVSADFFSTFGIPLLYGRAFQRSDIPNIGNTQVAIVSQGFSKAFWGNDNPVGKMVITPEGARLQVIGIAANASSEHFGELDGPRLYTLQDAQSHQGQLFVRFKGDAAPMTASIGAIVRSLDADQLDPPATVWDFLEGNATSLRPLANIILFMAGIAVVLAITGIYGVLTFAISQRTREFGIKMMLGATRQLIFQSVMKRGLRQVALGIAIGIVMALPAAWAFMRLMKNAWMRVDAFDATVYSISTAILLAVSFLAMLLPALRATQVDPIEALRNE